LASTAMFSKEGTNSSCGPTYKEEEGQTNGVLQEVGPQRCQRDQEGHADVGGVRSEVQGQGHNKEAVTSLNFQVLPLPPDTRLSDLRIEFQVHCRLLIILLSEYLQIYVLVLLYSVVLFQGLVYSTMHSCKRYIARTLTFMLFCCVMQ
jgi:hypothetical protein